jgi:hypothetical protein
VSSHYSNKSASYGQSEKKAVNAFIAAEAKKFRSEMPSNRRLVPLGYLRASYQVEINTSKVTSILVNFKAYSAAAANESQWFVGFNWLNQRRLYLKDIFLADIDYAAVFSVLAGQMLEKKNFSTECVLSALSTPNLKPEFVLTPHGIELIYNEGLVDAIANGSHSFLVPYEQVKSILAPSIRKLISKDSPGTVVQNYDFEVTKEKMSRNLAIIAIATLSKVIAEEPQNMDALRARSDWYQKLGRYEAAASDAAASDAAASDAAQAK